MCAFTEGSSGTGRGDVVFHINQGSLSYEAGLILLFIGFHVSLHLKDRPDA